MESLFLLLLCIAPNWMQMITDESKHIADWSAKHYLHKQDVTVWVRGIVELHNSSQKVVSVQYFC